MGGGDLGGWFLREQSVMSFLMLVVTVFVTDRMIIQGNY